MSFTKISVLVPTRQRLARLETLLASYARTVHPLNHDAELVFRVDDDDHDTALFLAALGHLMIVGPRRQGYQSLPSFFNELLPASTGDVLLCGNDDMVFKTPGWPALVLAAANLFPDGLFDLGVTTLNETHYPFSIISRAAAERLGFVWDPRIFWGDLFLRDVMAAFGRSVMIPAVEIEHDWAGHHPDRVFVESDKHILRRDPTYFQGTHARAVRDAVDRLRGLAA
jgi:hypothetical protein